MLLGRVQERRHIELTLETARSGVSAMLAFAGEAGIGKTALLGPCRRLAAGMQLLRARGIESEAQIPFGSLFELLRPALVRSRRSRPAGGGARGRARVAARGAQERFAVGAATLSLLAALAERAPWRCSSTMLTGSTIRAHRLCCSPSAGC